MIIAFSEDGTGLHGLFSNKGRWSVFLFCCIYKRNCGWSGIWAAFQQYGSMLLCKHRVVHTIRIDRFCFVVCSYNIYSVTHIYSSAVNRVDVKHLCVACRWDFCWKMKVIRLFGADWWWCQLYSVYCGRLVFLVSAVSKKLRFLYVTDNLSSSVSICRAVKWLIF